MAAPGTLVEECCVIFIINKLLPKKRIRFKEKFEDTEREVIINNSSNDRLCNGSKKRYKKENSGR
jgi:hypothetical protein